MHGCQKGGVMREIGQNDGGGDRGERWEYDIAHTHTHTRTHKSPLIGQGTKKPRAQHSIENK